MATAVSLSGSGKRGLFANSQGRGLQDHDATVKLLWIAAVVELGDPEFGRGLDFWCGATGATRSEPAEPPNEAVTLLPRDGDPFLRVQRSTDGTCGIRLELFVASPAAAEAKATALGALVVAESGFVTLRSPGGLDVRFVAHQGARTVPGAVTSPSPNQVDQLCIDIPPALYDAECAFWTELIGWELHDSALSEFRWFDRPEDLPLRFLLQRLDSTHVGQPTRAHLDIACGEHAEEISKAHTALGATRLGRTKRWIRMRDPAGLDYCLTPRLPPEGPAV